MAVIRANVKEHYGVGEVWSNAGNETAARQEVEEWCARNPPWEMKTQIPLSKGDDGNYRFTVEREVRPAG